MVIILTIFNIIILKVVGVFDIIIAAIQIKVVGILI